MIDAIALHRIRRLVANGWRVRRIAHEMGLPAGSIRRALTGPIPR